MKRYTAFGVRGKIAAIYDPKYLGKQKITDVLLETEDENAKYSNPVVVTFFGGAADKLRAYAPGDIVDCSGTVKGFYHDAQFQNILDVDTICKIKTIKDRKASR